MNADKEFHIILEKIITHETEIFIPATIRKNILSDIAPQWKTVKRRHYGSRLLLYCSLMLFACLLTVLANHIPEHRKIQQARSFMTMEKQELTAFLAKNRISEKTNP